MTTPDPLTRAAAKLRDSAAALPAEFRTRAQWREDGSHVVVAVGDWPDHAFTVGAPIAGHVALTASPDVTETTAALLAAVARQATSARHGWLDQQIEDASLALAAAIERQET